MHTYISSACYIPGVVFNVVRYILLYLLNFYANKNLQRRTKQQRRSVFVKELVTQFVRDLDYHPEVPIGADNVTHQTLRNEFASYNTGPWFDVLCRESASMAEVSAVEH